jgi:hypothetical protein
MDPKAEWLEPPAKPDAGYPKFTSSNLPLSVFSVPDPG